MKARVEKILSLLDKSEQNSPSLRGLNNQIRQLMMETILIAQETEASEEITAQNVEIDALRADLADKAEAWNLSTESFSNAGVALLFLSGQGTIVRQVGSLAPVIHEHFSSSTPPTIYEIFRGRDGEYCASAFRRALASQQKVQMDVTLRWDGRSPRVFSVVFVPLEAKPSTLQQDIRAAAFVFEQTVPEQGHELLQKHFVEVPIGAKIDFFKRSFDFLSSLPDVDGVFLLSMSEEGEAQLLDLENPFENSQELGILEETLWQTGQNGSSSLFELSKQLDSGPGKLKLLKPPRSWNPDHEASRLFRVTLDERGKACGLIYLWSRSENLQLHGNSLRVVAVRLSAEFEWYRAERRNRLGQGRLENLIHDRTQELVRKNQQLQGLLEKQKSTEVRLAQAKEEAEKATQAKSHFVASISHEIRTPLNGILGTLSILETRGVEAEQARYFNILKQSSQSLLRLINDVLDFSKIEADKLEIELAPCKLASTFHSAIESHQVELDRKSLKVEFAPSNAQNVTLFCDEVRVRQIFENFLTNAIKFSANGGLVSVKMRILGSEGLYFSVQDRGIGIPKSQQTKLFQSFSRVHTGSRHKYSGTGLGLAICKRIVERMEGRIALRSDSGFGSRFAVYLPVTVLEPGQVRGLSWNSGRTFFEPGKVPWESQRPRHEPSQEPSHEPRHEPSQRPSPLGMEVTQHPRLGASAALEKSPAEAVESAVPRSGSQSGVPRTESQSEVPKERKLAAEGLKILVAEDNDFNLVIVVQMLEMLGATVVTARDGVEALNMASTEDFDHIFLDFFMPEMDGGEVAERLRSLLKTQKTPIVALTANLEASEELKRYAPSFDRVLTKPVTLPVLSDYFRSRVGSPRLVTSP